MAASGDMPLTPEQLAAMPAMRNPDSSPPDFNQYTEYPMLMIISFSVTFFFATLFMTLRLYTTAIIQRRFDLDDGLIIVAWGFSLAFTIIVFITIDRGYGKHLWNVTALQAMDYLSISGANVLTYSWSVSFTKFAMLALYHRINTNLCYRLVIYATVLGILGYQVTFTYLFIGPCEPSKQQDQQCLNRSAIAHSILNITFDVFVILIPVPTIISLQMARKQKALLIGVMALGSGAAIVSAVKMAWVIEMNNNPDFTYTQGPAAVFSLWEANVGIWCNNLVRLKPFIRKKMPRFYKLLNSEKYSNSQSIPSRPVTHGRSHPNHELYSMRKSGIPLGSEPDMPLRPPGQIRVTTGYAVESRPNSNIEAGPRYETNRYIGSKY